MDTNLYFIEEFRDIAEELKEDFKLLTEKLMKKTIQHINK